MSELTGQEESAPPKVVGSRTTTEERSIELTYKEVDQAIQEWAEKHHAFKIPEGAVVYQNMRPDEVGGALLRYKLERKEPLEPPKPEPAVPIYQHPYPVQALTILGGALTEAPIYNDRKKARNWLAKIQPNADAPGGWDRVFMRTGRGKEMLYVIADIFIGDVLEFAADDVNYRDKKTPDRVYAFVVGRTENELQVILFEEPDNAWKYRLACGWSGTANGPQTPKDGVIS